MTTRTHDGLYVASLDPQDLAVERTREVAIIPGQPCTPSEAFRHSCWRAAREKVYRAMLDTSQSVSRIARFCDCGTDGWILRNAANPLEIRYATNACHDRLCVPCAADRSRVITSNIIKLLAGQPCRFVTLTLRGGETDLAFGIRRLLLCFRRLRQRQFWKSRVKGGTFFVEFKWSPKSLAWHVHLHVICYGRYLPQEDLSRQWYDVTGDSPIVHVEFVRDNGKVARYVAKYVTKPWDRDDTNAADRLAEIVSATHRRRLIGGFGDWRDVELTERPNAGQWIIVGDIETIAARARDGDMDAIWMIGAALGDAEDHLMRWLPDARPPPSAEPKPHPVYEQLYFQTHRAGVPF